MDTQKSLSLSSELATIRKKTARFKRHKQISNGFYFPIGQLFDNQTSKARLFSVRLTTT